ncbi:hypothetical protein SCB71_03585 [Herbiconiux sp. KACC 21604]|uniref:hypothetical protein n=1 Tax=unclassified Herbiconiux TaxID=2618217 RepID=UPI00149233D8|nr:hypothetical protein [Herbiconiux sp. SALV-R1]QJU52462.1 hypothetical protein HL652_01550 [Herbiconiux sp. SALV-R1]WPO87333.1 hypothetical protein SCB71_03585 [Herbiconiux sp. KACC 21604]
MNRILRILALVAAALLPLPGLALATALPAVAVQEIAHGRGSMWLADGASWIGNYELDDGNMGYCIDVEKPAPSGASFDYLDGSSAALFSPDDSARLAYLSRTWGAPGDAVTAVAAQLATWTITGLAGHDQAYFAQRANGDADRVLELANRMLRQADGAKGASRGVRATLDLRLDAGLVVTDLVVDHLAGPAQAPPASHRGTLELRGATFENGARTMAVVNGTLVKIVPDSGRAVSAVTVSVSYPDLPYGPRFRLAQNRGGTQSLLVQSPFPTSASASASDSVPNPRPFRPRVETITSAAVAAAGAGLHDRLEVSAHPDSPTGGEWGVYRAADGTLAPIPVVVSSRLLGPFGTRPVRSSTVPADAPVVCEVETAVTTGSGRYDSPECTVPAAGFYVWVDSIDPRKTPPERGGGRLQGWTSEFGVASETTLVPATPIIETTASTASTGELSAPGCVSDRLLVSGLPSGAPPIEVVSTLLGPLDHEPAEGAEPEGWHDYPVAGSVTTTVLGDGAHESPCVEVSAPGFYYFVVDSVPSTDRFATTPVVSAFADHRVHASESVRFPAPTPPPSPTPPPTPPAATPPAPASGPPAASPPGGGTPPAGSLAQTGLTPPPLGIAGLVVAIMMALGTLGLVVGRRP